MPTSHREGLPASGFINLLKPPGVTSYKAVAQIKGLFGTKTGHAGTLDPAAAGVLVLCLGKATRLASWVGESSKTYRAEVTFGIATDTLDAEGQVTAEGDAGSLDEPALRSALAGFVGKIEQVPPAFSAVQVGGIRLYSLARKGQPVAAPARQVIVHSIELLSFDPGKRATAVLHICCGKGTYIRSLCSDIARSLGLPAYVSFLLRTAVGNFDISHSHTLEEVQQAVAAGTADSVMLPLDAPLQELPAAVVGPDEARLLGSGRAIKWRDASAPTVRVYDRQGNLMALAKATHGGALRPTLVLAQREQP